MKIAIIDKIGLKYCGDTLTNRGLGGSESAVILISKELVKLGFSVVVYNNCDNPGTYDNVVYKDNSMAKYDETQYDIVIVSRSVLPFMQSDWPIVFNAKKKILWLHDTFVEGDEYVEELVVNKQIDYIFTLSDWHTSYILNCDHGKRRNYEVLKKSIFQTRNGVVRYIDEVDISKKDNKHFVYNANATKGLIPLIEDIWPAISKEIPDARLSIIGGHYNNDSAEHTLINDLKARQDLKDLNITFTGVIPPFKVAEILANAWMTLYPSTFPETFGISTLESILYKTPVVCNRFGALEETAIDKTCFLLNYPIEPNSLFTTINKQDQINLFLKLFFEAYNDSYLMQQKQNYCAVIDDIAGWDTIALQWKQFFYSILDNFLPVYEFRQVSRINTKVSRVFGRNNNSIRDFISYGEQRRIVIISPFFNSGSYTVKNILSVSSQDYDNYMHVLIDDASTDDTLLQVNDIIQDLPEYIREKYKVISNSSNQGAIKNQLDAIDQFVTDDDIVVLLDGDDWLVNNNTILHYYNDIYNQGYEFTYGSMWSAADSIPLIAQEYPAQIKHTKKYRSYLFNWGIPYTHLRTVLGKYLHKVDQSKFKTDNKWLKSGTDNLLFYELIEQLDTNKIYCNKEIVCVYNDTNPLNDYKIKAEEQNANAMKSYKTDKTILIAIPSARYIEPETFKSLWNLKVPQGFQLEFQYFYGYSISQVRNLIADWAKNYDYLFCIDSDIIVPCDALEKMIKADKDIISGLYVQRIENKHILEIYSYSHLQGFYNISYNQIKDSPIVEIAACGMGCALIKSSVIRTLDYPHYVYQEAIDHKNSISEDIYFCIKAKNHGFSVWADPSIICDHKGTHIFKV